VIHSPPKVAPRSKSLPARPHLGYLKKLAKERLTALRADQPSARLAQAQLAVAREYGFASWRKLKAHIAASSTPASAEQIASFDAAIRKGDASIVDRMLRKIPALANSTNSHGESVLHLAAEHNHPAIVTLLLAAGANLAAKYGRSAHTPLSWAVTVGSFQAAGCPLVFHG